jgi:phenylacetate-CoA ligase
MGRYLEVCQKLGLDPVKDVGLNLTSGGSHDRMPLLTAGIECYTFLGDTCGKASSVGGGAHLNEDWAVVQAVDPDTGRDVPDGEWGHLVVTTLDRDNGLLRYNLEEACAIDRRPCPCGETTARGFWGGRFKDLLAVQGKRLQPSQLERALRAVAAVCTPSLEWVVVRPKEPRAPLQLKVELGEGDRAAMAAACAAAIEGALGIEAQVVIVERGALPRSAYKTSRVIDQS